jgi:hypothetical protein
MYLHIHYYDPEFVTRLDDKGAWLRLHARIDGEGLRRGDEEEKVLEPRRTAWVHSLFPQTIGKTMITRVQVSSEFCSLDGV